MLDSFFEWLYVILASNKHFGTILHAFLRSITPRRLKRFGVSLAINENDAVISSALFLGVYENREIKIFKSLIKDNSVILDIGANIGVYSAVAASSSPKSRIFSFEPDGKAFERLVETIRLNAFMNIIAVNAAASNKDGVSVLYSSLNNGGDNRMSVSSPNEDFTANDVVCVNIDDFLGKHNLYCVDVIKVDVQGYEPFVFEGMRRCIINSPEVVALTEFWPAGICSAGNDPSRFLGLLSDLGFRKYDLSQGGREVDDFNLLATYKGRKYTNLLLKKTPN